MCTYVRFGTGAVCAARILVPLLRDDRVLGQKERSSRSNAGKPEPRSGGHLHGAGAATAGGPDGDDVLAGPVGDAALQRERAARRVGGALALVDTDAVVPHLDRPGLALAVGVDLRLHLDPSVVVLGLELDDAGRAGVAGPNHAGLATAVPAVVVAAAAGVGRPGGGEGGGGGNSCDKCCGAASSVHFRSPLSVGASPGASRCQ